MSTHTPTHFEPTPEILAALARPRYLAEGPLEVTGRALYSSSLALMAVGTFGDRLRDHLDPRRERVRTLCSGAPRQSRGRRQRGPRLL